jgi:hypothetical protein
MWSGCHRLLEDVTDAPPYLPREGTGDDDMIDCFGFLFAEEAMVIGVKAVSLPPVGCPVASA